MKYAATAVGCSWFGFEHNLMGLQLNSTWLELHFMWFKHRAGTVPKGRPVRRRRP